MIRLAHHTPAVTSLVMLSEFDNLGSVWTNQVTNEVIQVLQILDNH